MRGSRDPHMQPRIKRMMKTLRTGTMARARAEKILRRDRRRPKRRSTRRARMTRTTPVGSLVRTRETRDMLTTNMSSQYLPGRSRYIGVRIANIIATISRRACRANTFSQRTRKENGEAVAARIS